MKSVVTFRDRSGQALLEVTFPRGLSMEDLLHVTEVARGVDPQTLARLLEDLGRRTNQMLVIVDSNSRRRRAA